MRGTSYLFPPALATNPLTNAQAAAYVAQGFEIAVHVDSNPTLAPTGPRPRWTLYYTTLINSFAAQYPSVPAPKTHRMHCIGWSDYDSQPLDRTEPRNPSRHFLLLLAAYLGEQCARHVHRLRHADAILPIATETSSTSIRPRPR